MRVHSAVIDVRFANAISSALSTQMISRTTSPRPLRERDILNYLRNEMLELRNHYKALKFRSSSSHRGLPWTAECC